MATNLTGATFGRWTVIAPAPARRLESGATRSQWLCRCECGAERAVDTVKLTGRKPGGCGCRQSHHGLSATPTYKCWSAMLWRCRDKQNRYYGGRGITVCERWESFANFLADMGPRPDGMELDRIDNDGNYEPGNCRWADRRVQNNNRGDYNRSVTFEGRTQTVTEWARERGLPWQTVYTRIYHGWSVEKALSTPVDPVRQVAAGGGTWSRAPRMLTASGRTQSTSEWARELGVRPQTIRNRLNAGWAVEAAVTTPVVSPKGSETSRRARKLRAQ